MDNSLYRSLVITFGILVGLSVVGYFFPGSLDWGFHFLGFLPLPVLVLYLLVAGTVVVLVNKGSVERLLNHWARAMEARPWRFLVWINCIFIAGALVLRVKASVLGDSFTLIYNFRYFFEGIEAFLAPWHEPLSIYVLYGATKLLGSLDYPTIFTSFVVVELALGVCFTTCTFLLAREVFTEPLHRFATLIFLLVAPYMEFYFGYIEVYCVSLMLLTVFVLLSLLVLRHKMPFSVVPLAWVVVTLSHYINGLLGLSVLYLAYREYKRNNVRGLLIGFGAAGLLVAVVLAAVGFDTNRLINQDPISHFLSVSDSITPVNAYSQAYTIFSFYHVVDLANYLLFIAPFALLIIITAALRGDKATLIGTPENKWLVIAASPIFAYLLVAKLEQGAASDWDAFGAQFFLLNLFAMLLFVRNERWFHSRTLALLLCASTLQCLVWFEINATREPNIRRFEALRDRRILSQMGNYTHVLRLYRYFDSQDDTSRRIEVWDRYTELYPNDPRGYANELALLNLLTPTDYSRRVEVYGRELRVDPRNDSLRRELAGVCVDAGTMYFTANRFDSAGHYYRTAIENDSTSAKAFNDFGSVLAQTGKIEQAIEYFQKAVALDSEYREAYFNLGTAYIDRGMKDLGYRSMRRAAQLGNPQAKEFLSRKHGRI